MGAFNDLWPTIKRTKSATSAPHDVETGLLTTSMAFPLAICPGWQVAFDRLQWILQSWRAPRWRDRAFCRTRAGLEQGIGELIGREHQAAVAQYWHPDVDGVPERNGFGAVSASG